MPKTQSVLTPIQAQLLVDAFDIDMMLDSEEECDMLEEHNPELLAAYRVLKQMICL